MGRVGHDMPRDAWQQLRSRRLQSTIDEVRHERPVLAQSITDAPADSRCQPGSPGGTLSEGGTDVLWSQVTLPGGTNWTDQGMTDAPTFSSYIVSDISTESAVWNVDEVTVYFSNIFSINWSPLSVKFAYLSFFPKTGPLPSDVGDIVPGVLVPVTTVDKGTHFEITASTNSIPALDSISGEFWIGLTPRVKLFVFGQEYHFKYAGPIQGDQSAVRNPGGGYGDGPNWNSVGDLDGQPFDTSIMLKGSVMAPSPWSDEGGALAGALGNPHLGGTGILAAGSTNSVDLTDAAASATAALFTSLSSTPFPFKGGTLIPFPFLPPLFLPTSAAGTISLPFVMPTGIPPGTELWVQWGIQDPAALLGVALSNAIKGVTP